MTIKVECDQINRLKIMIGLYMNKSGASLIMISRASGIRVGPAKFFVSATVLLMITLALFLLYTQPVFSQANNNTVDALMVKGVSQYKGGNYTEAIPYYNEILSIDPNNTGAIYNKGLALDILGKYEDAINHYSKVLQVLPNSTGALVNTGGALADLGNFGEAINYFDKTLSIDPNNTIAIENKKYALSLMSGDR